MLRAELLEQVLGLGPAGITHGDSFHFRLWLGGGSSNRKRVFIPGFVALCIFVAVVELIALHQLYALNEQ
jgi:hypothetical protein